MTVTLTARPTTYNGIEMRSRLEARFAAFLDSCEIPWEYEPRAFASGHQQYLPDFAVAVPIPFRYLNGRAGAHRMYLELKPDVADLEAAWNRLEVIWRSEPDAVLAFVSAANLEETGLFGVQVDGSNNRVGAFVVCPMCSWTFIGFSLETRRMFDRPIEESRYVGYCPLCEAETVAFERRPMPAWNAQ